MPTPPASGLILGCLRKDLLSGRLLLQTHGCEPPSPTELLTPSLPTSRLDVLPTAEEIAAHERVLERIRAIPDRP